MSARKIRKLLVANRGEIALRVFQTCNNLGIATVAVHSEADRRSPHRYGAVESIEIGPPAAAESYLRADRVIDAATETGADAIHPGYGFLSENADFAAEVEAAGITFVGPRPQNIRDMGDKVRARELMLEAGVPIVPGSATPITRPEELKSLADSIGYPLLIKAAGGGGGKGIRRVDDASQLQGAFERATSEADSAFGDARVYVERFVSSARHIEAQVFGDGEGGGLFLGERECSLQRNHQKLVEESPSPVIDDSIRARIRKASLDGVRSLRYRGAGTFEYLYDETRSEFYFLEMNTRLQVEHPVTEMVTRLDLVAEQIRIAEGGTLADATEPVPSGHAIEMRIYAEDPYRGFVPSTGTIHGLRLPHAPFTRIDHALRDDYEIPPYYDPMLAKAVAWGRDRSEAIVRLTGLLRRTRIGGIHTTIPLGLDICRWDAFQNGDFDTGSLEEWLSTRSYLPEAPPALLTQIAGIAARHALANAATRTVLEPGAFDQGAWGEAAKRDTTGRSRR